MFACNGAVNIDSAVRDTEIDQAFCDSRIRAEPSAELSTNLRVRGRFVRIRRRHQYVSQYAMKRYPRRHINIILAKHPGCLPCDIRVEPHVRHVETSVSRSFGAAFRRGTPDAAIGPYEDNESAR
jgi:hypothetical protein